MGWEVQAQKAMVFMGLTGQRRLGSEANGRVVHRKGFVKTYSTNIVEGAGHS